MRFTGWFTDPDTGKSYEVDTEAYDESPDAELIIDDDGSGRLVEPGTHDNAIPFNGFYVGTVETEDGDFHIDSTMIMSDEQPDLCLEDDSEDDDDYFDEEQLILEHFALEMGKARDDSTALSDKK